MTEEELKAMKLNEVKADGNGNKYIRVPNGWIWTNFAGQIQYIPEVAGEVTGFEKSVVKKDLTTELPIRKSRTTK